MFLKNTSAYAALVLCKLFQQSLDHFVLPKVWKIGKVISIHKSGSKAFFNYRPIYLTSTSSKMLDHIIFTNFVSFLESNSFFSSAQHGFKNIIHVKLSLYPYSCSTSSSRVIINCIFLDFCKAFDKVRMS